MDSAALATLPSESDISTTQGISGEKVELTQGYSFSAHEDESVKEIVCTGVLEYVAGNSRGWFMEQCYRILVNGGTMTVTVPYWSSWRAYYDARFEWPPFCEQSFLCYNKAWREANTKGLELECDFDFTYGYAWDQTTLNRNDEARAFWTQRYNNCVEALQLTLTKRPK